MAEKLQSFLLRYLNDVLHGTLITTLYVLETVIVIAWHAAMFFSISYLVAYAVFWYAFQFRQRGYMGQVHEHGDGIHNVDDEEENASVSHRGDQGSRIILVQESQTEAEEEEHSNTSSSPRPPVARDMKPRMVSTLAQDLLLNNTNTEAKKKQEQEVRLDDAFGILTPANSKSNHALSLSEIPRVQPAETKPSNILPNLQEIALAQDKEHIVFHQFPRGRTKPCMSIAACFIETYIRLTGIPCEVKLDCLDVKGPSITTRSQHTIRGTRNCLKYLKQTFPGQTVLHASNPAISSPILFLLDGLSKSLKSWKWFVENGQDYAENQPGWDIICDNDLEGFTYKTKHALWQKGCTKITSNSLEKDIVKFFSKLGSILGGQAFLTGGHPTEIDCEAYANLSEVVWGRESSIKNHLREVKNLVDYCARMRNLLWPDWEDQLCQGPVVEEYKFNRKPALEFNDRYYMLSPDLEDASENENASVTSTSETTFSFSRREKQGQGLHCETESVFFLHRTTSKFSNYKRASRTVNTDYFDEDFSDMQDIMSPTDSHVT